MIERVRAILITPTGEALLIRRERPDTPVYWVLPGGQVEPTDTSHEDALRREIHEELAGTPEIHHLIQIINGRHDRQYIYLTSITDWSFPDRSGPEFTEAGRGTYQLDTIPLTTATLKQINLKPDALTKFLTTTLENHADLFTLPALPVPDTTAESSVTPGSPA